MKKRILACLLSVLMLFASWPAIAAEDTVVLTVNVPAAPISQGDDFTVTVELSNNPGISAIQTTLMYDNTKVECKTIVIKEVLRDMLSAKNPAADEGAIIASASLTATTEDGVLASYKFVAKEDIIDYDLGLEVVTLKDESGADIPYIVYVGSVKQEEPVVPEEDDEEEEDVTVAPSRPSGSDGSSGGSVTVPKEEEDDPVISDVDVHEKEEEENEEDVKDIVQDVIVHLFNDATNHWAESYINRAVEAGLFKGDDLGNFHPDVNITRAQFITVLWRMSGSPEATIKAPFLDTADQIPEFQAAIDWGYEMGYINGVSDMAFDSDGTLTREAAMKILHSYSGGKTGNEFMFIDVYDNAYEDSEQISSWAKLSVYWGVYNKLISGISSTQLAPDGVASRAQIAKILVEYRDTFNK